MENKWETVSTIEIGNFILDVDYCPGANIDGSASYGVKLSDGTQHLEFWMGDIPWLKTALRRAKKAARKDRWKRLFDQAEQSFR